MRLLPDATVITESVKFSAQSEERHALMTYPFCPLLKNTKVINLFVSQKARLPNCSARSNICHKSLCKISTQDLKGWSDSQRFVCPPFWKWPRQYDAGCIWALRFIIFTQTANMWFCLYSCLRGLTLGIKAKWWDDIRGFLEYVRAQIRL
jgi:hypothetical protein